MKKILSTIIVLAMLLSVLPFGTLAASAAAVTADPADKATWQVEDNGGEKSVADYPDIKISKTIEPLKDTAGNPIENYFDITLRLTSPPHSHTHTGAVVLVIDNSGTMADDHNGGHTGYANSRMKDAKEAAVSFVNALAAKEGDHQVGIVTFATNAVKVSELKSLGSNKNDILGAIAGNNINDENQGIKANLTDEPDKRLEYTNIEGGLTMAYDMLKGSSADYKYIILLTDGFPTTYLQSKSGNTYLGYSTHMEDHPKYKELGKDAQAFYQWILDQSDKEGLLYNTRWGVPCLYGTNYSDEGAKRAAAVAKKILEDTNNDINLFSIGLDIGAQSVEEYDTKRSDANGNAFSIVDQQYGDGTPTIEKAGKVNNSYYAGWLSSLAGGPIFSDPELKKYWDANSGESLEHAYDDIIKILETVQRHVFREAEVVDPMGQNVEFLGFYTYDGKLTKSALPGAVDTYTEEVLEYGKQSAHTPGLYGENKASFSNNTIVWDPVESGWRWDGTYADNDPARPNYYMELKYRVRLTNENAGYSEDNDPTEQNGAEPDTYNPTNGKTTFTYYDFNNDKKPIEEFPIPAVEGYLGHFEFTKTDDAATPNALGGAVFSLVHSTDCPVCKAGGGTPAFTVPDSVSDTDGKVKFENLPSGHEYILSEKTAPAGYKRTNDSWKVVVSYNETKVYAYDAASGAYSTTALDLSAYSVINKPLDDIEISVNIQKLIDADAAAGNLDGRTFKFAIKDELGNPLKDSAGNDITVETSADGKASFSLKFGYSGAVSADGIVTEAIGDLNTATGNAKEYIFKIAELRDADDNHEELIYDTADKTVKVTVSFNSDMTAYSAAVTYVDDLAGVADDALTVNNRSRTPVEVPLSVLKTLDGTAPGGKEFSFVLKDENGTEIEKVTSDGTTGKVQFANLAFSQSGTYKYYISEVSGSDDISYDTSIYEVTVTVAKPDADAEKYTAKTKIVKKKGSDRTVVVAEAADFADSFSNTELTFENKTRLAVTVPLKVQKTFDGAAPGSKEFSFILVNLNDSAEIYTCKNDADGNVIFPAFETRQFDKTGTYEYLLYEATLPAEKEANEQWVYDPVKYLFTVTVTAPAGTDSYKAEAKLMRQGYAAPFSEYSVSARYDNGSAVQSVEYTFGSEAAATVEFENGTREKASIRLGAVKKLNYLKPGKDDVFTFVLTETTGGKKVVIDRAKNNGYGVSFDKLYFDKSGTYTYTIHESKGSIPGMKYDDDVYTVKVVVSADTDTTDPFKIDVTYYRGDTEVTKGDVIFSNHRYGYVPDTGDLSSAGMFGALAVISAIAAVAIIIRKRRTNQ
ncbi:MAG: VWA domain-containing protein [Oscillospiraceae bacterium]|nr:VWA domain-containing protein [Oscillospiraceae bacterium]